MSPASDAPAVDREIRERLGVCLQQTVLPERLEVGETVSLFRAFYRNGRPPGDVIQDVGLQEKALSPVGKHGRIIAEGTPRELIRSLGGHVIEIAVEEGGPGELRPEDLDGLPSVRAVHAEAGHLVLTVVEPHVAIAPLLERVTASGFRLSSLATRHASLEDVFVSLTGRHLRDG
ncbi:MAG TPA: DUF4162 domain-containing protein [Vicinamibacteria bacterium]|nr:DUF4162 domain-containing protein [Vicinamibacteria bacterium]